jgi:hypothetical protein
MDHLAPTSLLAAKALCPRGYVGTIAHLGSRTHPLPPEDEPLAPTKVVKGIRGNRYTAEDKKYFAKYVSWALQDDPSLTKGEIIARLAERVRRLQKSAIGFDTSPVQVPHHTANSWASHWHRDPLADRLLTAAKEKTAEIYGNNVKDVGVDDDDDDDDSQDSEETSSCDEEEDDEAAMGGGAASLALQTLE